VIRKPAPSPSGEAASEGTAEADRALDALRGLLQAGAERLEGRLGIPRPRVEGKLLRPLVAWAAAPESLAGEDPRFAAGALAIQMVHEASLLHDDILDQCAQRRGEVSLAAEAGTAAALVEGDHLLTAAYRAAAETRSLDYVTCFAQAVERTVAGEKAQARAAGRWLTEAEYREIICGKSGELFGCAAALGAHLAGDAEGVARDRALGLRLGQIYQMVDDFLDLCPRAPLGKPPLLDLRQGKWTWPLAEAGVTAFPAPDEVEGFVARLFGGEGEGHPAIRASPSGDVAPPPMVRAFARLEGEVQALERAWREAHPDDTVVPALLDRWLVLVRRTLDAELRAHGRGPGGGHAVGEAEDAFSLASAESHVRPVSGSGAAQARRTVEDAVREEALALGGAGGWEASFARHARSFRFAARLFPPEPGRLVAGVYAFCRFTDDLVDHAPDPDPEVLAARLAAWSGLVRRAWSHADTGIPLLDEVLGETARRGVPSLYAEELIRGVAMDLEPVEYADLDALRLYSYRVASVVGLWLSELFGTRNPTILRRAEAMGHAMQLTNILRDVGEDWTRGRLYLPRDRMAAHGVTPEAIGLAVAGGPLPDGWVPLMQELVAVADADYDLAFEAIPALPVFFQRPVAVAARVYQGIHAELGRAGWDSLTRRSWTGLPTKLRLGGAALLELRRARRRYRTPGMLRPLPSPPLPRRS
jgi:phytoene synthase